MLVAYVTPFYNGACEGKLGRFHDWVHTLRDMDERPFKYSLYPFTATNPDESVASEPGCYLGDGDELWGTKEGTLERALNVRRIIRDLNELDPDIVHVVLFDPIINQAMKWLDVDAEIVYGPNIGGWYPNRSLDILHRSEVANWKLKSKFYLRKFLFTQELMSAVLSFSEYHKEMIKHLGIPKSKITVLKPGVSSLFTPRPEPRENEQIELLYVGKMSEQKGYPLTLRAIAKLETAVHLRVIGSGDSHDTLRRELGVADQVTVEGFVARERLPQYYNNADLFIMPSIDEMSPNTQFEALACATPVVATDTPGINEFLPEDAVRCFWPREPDVLASAINDALNCLPLLSRAAAEHAEEFRARTTVNQLDELYRSVRYNSL